MPANSEDQPTDFVAPVVSAGMADLPTERASTGPSVRLRRAPRLLMHSIFVGAALVVLIARSVPHLHDQQLVYSELLSPFGLAALVAGLAMLTLVGVVVVWVARASVAVLTMRRASYEAGRARWLVMPTLLVCLTALWVTDTPLRVRWFFAHDDLKRELSRFDESDSNVRQFTVSGYRIRGVSRFGDSTRFVTSVRSGEGGSGFVHLPSGLNVNTRTQGFSSPHLIDLGGDWYAYIGDDG